MYRLKTSKNNFIDLNVTNSTVVEWVNRQNETAVIGTLNQINSGHYGALLSDKENYVILDIGANVGLFSLYAADSARAVYAVEPSPEAFNIMTHLTRDHDKIHLVQRALDAKDGVADFYQYTTQPQMNSLYVKFADSVATQVPVRTIASLLKELNLDHVDFVKCDIEGAENYAITVDLLKEIKDKIACWWVEVHPTDVSEKPWPGNLEENRQKLLSVFDEAGYDAKPMIHDQIIAYRTQE